MVPRVTLKQREKYQDGVEERFCSQKMVTLCGDKTPKKRRGERGGEE